MHTYTLAHMYTHTRARTHTTLIHFSLYTHPCTYIRHISWCMYVSLYSFNGMQAPNHIWLVRHEWPLAVNAVTLVTRCKHRVTVECASPRASQESLEANKPDSSQVQGHCGTSPMASCPKGWESKKLVFPALRIGLGSCVLMCAFG